jgi:hypothetical protein
MVEKFKYRFDPVPYAGKRIRSHLFRKMRTTQELKWNEAYSEYVRSKRKKNYLTNAWDDIIIDRNDRSWKSSTKRKKQWKIIKDNKKGKNMNITQESFLCCDLCKDRIINIGAENIFSLSNMGILNITICSSCRKRMLKFALVDELSFVKKINFSLDDCGNKMPQSFMVTIKVNGEECKDRPKPPPGKIIKEGQEHAAFKGRIITHKE